MGNTMIGAKWRFFWNEETGTVLAIRPELAAPVWDVTEQWKLALDLGTESSRADGDIALPPG